MRPGTSVKKSLMRAAEVIARRVERAARSWLPSAATPAPARAGAEAFARREDPQPRIRYRAGGQQRRVRPHRLRLDADPYGRAVGDDRVRRRVVLDHKVEIGPAHQCGPRGPDVDVIEPAVRERRSGAQVLVRRHASNVAGRDQVGVEHEHVAGFDPELHVTGPRPREPGMPAESHGTRAGVLADLELEVETRGAEPQRLPRRAAEGPPTPAQLTRQRHDHVALREDRPRLLEAEPMDRRRRKVRLQTDLAVIGRDPAVGEPARPGDHRKAAPVDMRRDREGTLLGHDPLSAADDQRDEPAAFGRLDPGNDLAAAELHHVGRYAGSGRGSSARVSRMNAALPARYDWRSAGNRRARSFFRAA